MQLTFGCHFIRLRNENCRAQCNKQYRFFSLISLVPRYSFQFIFNIFVVVVLFGWHQFVAHCFFKIISRLVLQQKPICFIICYALFNGRYHCWQFSLHIQCNFSIVPVGADDLCMIDCWFSSEGVCVFFCFIFVRKNLRRCTWLSTHTARLVISKNNRFHI